MKKNIIFVILGISLTLTSAYSLFRKTSASSNAAAEVKTGYIQDIEKFQVSLNELKLATHFEDIEVLKNAFLQSRQDYKKIEALLEYIDPSFLQFFNGPNLIKADPGVLVENKIYPKGLQVLEELIFVEKGQRNLGDIQVQIQMLSINTDLWKQSVENLYLTDRIIFEACRANLIRIFTLGLTGFDSPVIKNSIPESITSLKAIKEMLLFYKAYLYSKSPVATAEFFQTIEGAISFLEKNNNFDGLDRLHFLKEYINPLYAQIYHLHKASGIEMRDQVTPFLSAVHYDATNIFSEDFLNPYYFNKLKIDRKNNESIELGKLLFFDPVLSLDLQRSCASCHNPDLAFADGLTKSIALGKNGVVSRNSPTLINSIFQKSFFHDGREQFPEQQIDHVVFSDKEFNSSYELIITRIGSSTEYRELFSEAFPQYPGIDGYSVTKAIADYLRSLVALDSDFDKYVRNEKQHIPESVKQGFNLFMGKAQCGTCHFAPVFNGTVPPFYEETELEVLGVPRSKNKTIMETDPDLGKYYIHPASINKGAFKTGTIRNAELTAPYMHNGVFASLEDVMDFYNAGGGIGLGFEIENQTLPADSLHLSFQEISDIISFMKSLTDTSGVTSRPMKLPILENLAEGKNRVVGGEY